MRKLPVKKKKGERHVHLCRMFVHMQKFVRDAELIESEWHKTDNGHIWSMSE